MEPEGEKDIGQEVGQNMLFLTPRWSQTLLRGAQQKGARQRAATRTRRIFTMTMVQHCHRLPQEAVGSQSLEVFTALGDKAPGDLC